MYVDDLLLAERRPGLAAVVLVGHVAVPAGSSLTPRATIRSAPFGSGRCSFSASSGGAVIQVSISSAVARTTGIALGWMVPTSAVRVRGEERVQVVAGLAFLNLPDGRPVGPIAGEAGEGPCLVKCEPDVAAFCLVELGHAEEAGDGGAWRQVKLFAY
jgi:hypothetical protein